MKKLLVVAPLAMLLAAGCAANPTATGTPEPTAGSPAPTAGSPAPTAGSPAPTAGSPAPTQAGEAIVCSPGQSTGDVSAAIVDFAFEPASISASVGQVVAWTNNGEFPHTVTFDDGPDCGQLNGGGSVAAQFNQAGDYAFVCTIHPTMTGTVRVSP